MLTDDDAAAGQAHGADTGEVVREAVRGEQWPGGVPRAARQTVADGDVPMARVSDAAIVVTRSNAALTSSPAVMVATLISGACSPADAASRRGTSITPTAAAITASLWTEEGCRVLLVVAPEDYVPPAAV